MFIQVDLNRSPDPPALRGVTDLAPKPEGRDARGAAPGGAGRETQLRLEALRPVAGDDDILTGNGLVIFEVFWLVFWLVTPFFPPKKMEW